MVFERAESDKSELTSSWKHLTSLYVDDDKFYAENSTRMRCPGFDEEVDKFLSDNNPKTKPRIVKLFVTYGDITRVHIRAKERAREIKSAEGSGNMSDVITESVT